MQRKNSNEEIRSFLRCGENLTREWKDERLAGQVWDALSLADSDAEAGLEKLTDLADQNSALSAYYLGDAFLFGRYGIPKNYDKAEQWLRKSASLGSVEGRFLLAQFLQGSDKPKRAIEHYEILANKKFSPATYSLAIQYLKGNLLKKDLNKAKHYFEMARQQGHLHSWHWLSFLQRTYGENVICRTKGLINLVLMSVPFIYYRVFRPESDRLRT
ncbi:tetratricopeptide repeat protein [Pelagerythrobacter marensis]|uniref:Tetratricopeptide repeat protein n=1 Tax=Pelagerythrobacter marensis TaxID=543877 RepID=A0ABZ2D1L9_9SPHN